MRGDPGAGGPSPSPHPADDARAAALIASILAPPRDAGRAARVRRAKKVRARIGSVPASLREDAPNRLQRRTTRVVTAVGAASRKSLKRRLGR
ncbi:hypothetical protein MYA_2686 [Burkholderia sp. KJ006]|uniref:Uncharacterized protein n=1 Tax=Burkholderia vietnamiensis (strain G4 / LMG 22486) TaxID=269482 RepID=A4JIA8_BURVG|nr:hypothetical protein Bcep1808_3020 [Burkholderia vietnamiensis G4]AFJ87046.1 hypothetical protein MYA_2686 [Burkholderia sp. KJ006]RQM54213.1 hypothetical protein EHZ18_22775 [Burkholderia vietnamiensis]